MDYLALVFDAVLVLVFVSAVLEGRRRGFAVTALSFIASVISIIAAKEYSEPLAQWANNSFVHESIVNKLTDIISSNLGSGTETVIGALPFFDTILESAELSCVSFIFLADEEYTVSEPEPSTAGESPISSALILPAASTLHG